MLSNKDLAQITNALQTPVIIQDILDGTGELTNDVHLGLHEVLSEDQPDSALLSIAISALKIAMHYKTEFATMPILAMEAKRIIVEYGPIWLRNAQNRNVDDTLVFETLVHIPEDLDSLAELLEMTNLAIGQQNPDIAALCQIMIVQSGAQALIAETFLESMDMLDIETEDEETELYTTDYSSEDMNINTIIAADALSNMSQPFYTNNVVAFPGTVH